jgi:uncharacterized protein (DUF1778 family)
MKPTKIQIEGISQSIQDIIEKAATKIGLKKNAFIIMAATKEANKIIKDGE